MGSPLEFRIQHRLTWEEAQLEDIRQLILGGVLVLDDSFSERDDLTITERMDCARAMPRC